MADRPDPEAPSTSSPTVVALRMDVLAKLEQQLAKFPAVATLNDYYLALSYALRDRVLDRWGRSAATYLGEQHRTVIYLSAEYLIGPQLGNTLLCLGLEKEAAEAMRQLGLELPALIEHEEEPGLGNGGLGRLAACFMDSLATLEIPAIGHGLRYEFGIFDQGLRDGWQIERTDRWLRLGNPWEVRRFEIEIPVGFGGTTEHYHDEDGQYRVRWRPARVVCGVPYDTVVLGYGTQNANFLRLWSAIAAEEFDLDAFQVGAYWSAVEEKIRSENLTKVLYPNDSSAAGKQLRLEQQHFFVSCALQDCIRLLLQRTTIDHFGDKFALQLNDTHPSLGVAELMRLLMDVHGMGWDQAWAITHRSVSYTNHTLMPEALETWPLPLFAAVLPRHLEIIYEINRRFLEEVRARFPGDEPRIARMSLIDERGDKAVRMAHLATVASHKVNGVAELHSRLLRETVLRDFAEMYPERFGNVTNGVTPRRFIALANSGLRGLLDQVIGASWPRQLDRLEVLRDYADDPGFGERWRAVRDKNKRGLAAYLQQVTGRTFDATALFDGQCKRIHEYKRQHLNLLHAAWLHQRLRRGLAADSPARLILFAGKAAPSYWLAKLMIRLATAIAETVAEDPAARDQLAVVFVPDFSVKTAQHIYPAIDLSEQISTAGTEASGTGNMKFAMNGALTIGTLDGANVEIRDAVGADNFFLFGMTTEEVEARRRAGYDPRAVLEADPELAELLSLIGEGFYCRREPALFAPLLATLTRNDPFMVLADFRAYVEAQEAVARAWRAQATWTRASILNTAGMGRFSSDRSIREYAEQIWHVDPVDVSGRRR
ncbi:MAG: glycogen/starch/alpha-glucan phosphorylase [Myxococcales bacterium]|nr:glycogen/starch/alpha-glucan phosphorylase [Myxococcales bacterium]